MKYSRRYSIDVLRKCEFRVPPTLSRLNNGPSKVANTLRATQVASGAHSSFSDYSEKSTEDIHKTVLN